MDARGLLPSDERVASAMELALVQARLAAEQGEVPVGAALLGPDGSVLALGRNAILALSDPSAHAELLAIRQACASLGAPRLPQGSLLASTLEPCALCAGAIVLARVDHLVFGAADPKTGACGSLRDVVRDDRLNHRATVQAGHRAEECASLLTTFFQARRSPRTTNG